VILAAMILAGIVVVGCGGDKIAAPPVSLPGVTNNHGTEPAVDGMEVEADDVYFGPTFLTATPGQKFTIELRNEGTLRHTFTSDSLKVDLELPPGASRTVGVNAPDSGSVEFHCRLHQTQGMQGAVYVK